MGEIKFDLAPSPVLAADNTNAKAVTAARLAKVIGRVPVAKYSKAVSTRWVLKWANEVVVASVPTGN